MVVTTVFSAFAQLTPQTERASVSSAGGEANNMSWYPDMSSDGRYVVFASLASNLVVGDFNNRFDIFIRDRELGITSLITSSYLGGQADLDSEQARITNNGNYVTFQSQARDLVPNDTNNRQDAFVWNKQLSQTYLVSRSSTGLLGNNDSWNPVSTSDGRYVVFWSQASNLVPGDNNGAGSDVFLHDTLTGFTEMVSLRNNGLQGNDVSAHGDVSQDGRYIAFMSSATDLVADDNNGNQDIFIRDRVLGTTALVSVSSSETQSNGGSSHPRISEDGRFVFFFSSGSNLVPDDTNGVQDVFRRDMLTGNTERVSVGTGGIEANGYSNWIDISPDGEIVGFQSVASNLVSEDTNGMADVFVRNISVNQTILASIPNGGGNTNGESDAIAITSNGAVAAYFSYATNSVANDTNGQPDIFVTTNSGFGPFTQTFGSVGDTYLKEGQPNKNQGDEAILRIRQSGQNRSLVQFDQSAISSFVGSRSVTSATLRVYISLNSNNWGASGRDVGVHRITSPWAELGATWNCPDDTNTGNNVPDGVQWEMNNSSFWPFVSTASDTVLHTNGLVGWIEFDVTGDVQGFMTGNPNYGWLIKKINEGQSGSAEYSSKDGANPPELIITAQ